MASDFSGSADADIVLLAIAEGRLRVDLEAGRAWTKRSRKPGGTWREAALEAVRAPGRSDTPYWRLGFTCSKGRFRCLLHRVVWFAAGNVLAAGAQVNHKNGDKRDCSISNLEPLTQVENMAHARAIGLVNIRAPKRHHRNFCSKLRPEDVPEMRRRFERGETQAAIGASLGVSSSHVSKVLAGRHLAWVE